jgi:hypothetical protein
VREIIRLNNCGGKAEADQVAERSLDVTVEGAAEIKADIRIVSANVRSQYVENRNIRKTQTLRAPPGTNMEFELLWTEQQWFGTITSNLSSSEARYVARVPIAVELTQSRDIGCDDQPVPTVNNAEQTPVPGAPVLVELPPQPVATPEPTPLELTPSGAILLNGETWVVNGWTLKVSNFTYGTLNKVQFELTNLTGRTVLFPGLNSGITIVADRGYNLPCAVGLPKDQREIAHREKLKWELYFSSDHRWNTYNRQCGGRSLPSPETTSIVLVVEDIAGVIQNARWQADVPRP